MIEKITIKVRGYHLDVYGHVNNTRYLEFLEEARWCIKEKYFDFPQVHAAGYGFVVVNNNIDYLHPAGLGDVLEIQTFVKKIGTKSATFHHTIMLQGSPKVIAQADVTFVIVDLRTGKAIPITGEWRAKLESLQNENQPT
jgi:thioesterase-3